MNKAVIPSRGIRRYFTIPLNPLLQPHPPDPAGKKLTGYNVREQL